MLVSYAAAFFAFLPRRNLLAVPLSFPTYNEPPSWKGASTDLHQSKASFTINLTMRTVFFYSVSECLISLIRDKRRFVLIVSQLPSL
jgi:hypothetical protein